MEPDASDSRFASLVAQFTLPQAQLPPAVPSRAASQAPAEAGKGGSATPSAPAQGSPATAGTSPEPAAPEAPAAAGDPAGEAPVAASGASAPAQPGAGDPAAPGAPATASEAAAEVPPPGPRMMAEPLPLAGTQAPRAAGVPVAQTTEAPTSGPVQPLPAPQVPTGTGEAGIPASRPSPREASAADDTNSRLAPLLRSAAAKLPSAGVQDATAAGAAPASTPPPHVTVSFAGIVSSAAAPRVAVVAAPAAIQEPAPAPPLAGATPAGADRPLTAAPTNPGGGASTGSEAGDSFAQETAAKAESAAATLPGHLRPDAGTQVAAAASARPALTPEAAAAPTALPAAPAAPPAMAAAPVAQVDSGMKWMLRNGAQEARLQLHPDSLGQVTIHLRVEGGEVHAKLWVSEPASVQAVQEGRPHLELSLKEQGLQLGSFDLHQGHRPFQDAATPPNPRPADTTPAVPARQERPAVIVPTLQNPHQIELYA